MRQEMKRCPGWRKIRLLGVNRKRCPTKVVLLAGLDRRQWVRAAKLQTLVAVQLLPR